jgi:hypothetical protein
MSTHQTINHPVLKYVATHTSVQLAEFISDPSVFWSIDAYPKLPSRLESMVTLLHQLPSQFPIPAATAGQRRKLERAFWKIHLTFDSNARPRRQIPGGLFSQIDIRKQELHFFGTLVNKVSRKLSTA